MTFDEIILRKLIEHEKLRYSPLFQKLERKEKRRVIYLIEALRRLLEVLTDDGNEQMYIKESCKSAMSK